MLSAVKFISIITILITCNAHVCLAQHLNIYKYTLQDGLVNNDVLKIYQDQQGFIWICTRGGLSRYDGTRFTNYTTENGLTNDMINDIYEVAPQEFVIAQNLNGPRILKDGRIYAFSSPRNVTINNFYKTSDNRVLASTDFHNLIELKGNGFKQMNPQNNEHVHSVAFVNDSIWLFNQEGNSIQLVTTQATPFSPKMPAGAHSVYNDKQQRTWVGTGRGLKLLSPHQYRNTSIQFMPLPAAFNMPLLKEGFIVDMMQDSQMNLWVCTNTGLVVVRPNGSSTVFTEFDGLPASSINCIAEDRQKNIWIGTPLGLAKFSITNEVRIFSSRDGLSQYGASFVLPITKNRFRLFDYKNTMEFDLLSDKFLRYPLKDSLTYLQYKVSKKEVLLVKGNEAKIYAANYEQSQKINLPANSFWDIRRIDARSFVATCANSLFRVVDGRIQDSIVFPGFDTFLTLEFYKKDVLMVGCTNEGIYKVQISKDSIRVIDSITKILPDRHIRYLFTDRENELWVGTRYGGVIRVLETGIGKYKIQQYGTQQGLSSNFVKTINRDKKGNIWVGTTQGLDKLIPTHDKYKVFNFGRINKIYSQVLDIHFFDNDYLLAAGYPYLIYARDTQLDTLASPATYITKVKTELQPDGTPGHQQTRLAYNKAQIYFEFSTPQFINEDLTSHCYRLLGGNDTNWTMASSSRSVSFASLKPGKYYFEVKARGLNGDWGPITSHQFIVATPFWQQAWFILLIVSAIALFIYSLYRYRIRQLIRLQKVRNHIAADLHDEIGSNLTNISILSSLSKKNISKPQQATEFLQRISEEVSSSSQALDDIIWSVNSSHDTLDETVSRMRRYAAELFDAANIQYELHFDPIFEEQKLIMEQRRDIYLLYKEAVNNIFKHAKAKHVIIKIAIEHQGLVLDIVDDGKGFNTTKESDRHGLEGMKTRVDKWKGKMQITSAENKGTIIHCTFPLTR